LCDHRLELLLREIEATDNKSTSEDEQEIAKQTTEERALNELKFTLRGGSIWDQSKERQELTCFNAMPAIIISTTFPRVALSKPPTLWLVRRAICSVPKPRSAAKGIIARAEKTKINVELWWV
jgi:hypothetical protein